MMNGFAYRRPCVSLEFAEQLAKKFYNFERINEIRELDSYIDRNFYVRGHRRNSNANQEDFMNGSRRYQLEQGEYVLKVLNSDDSKHGEFVDVENEAMKFLREKGFPCPSLFPLAGVSEMKYKLLVRIPLCKKSTEVNISSIQVDANRNIQTTDDEWCIIRLISFLPGQTAESLRSKMSCENLFTVGQFIGNVSKVFQDFQGSVSLSKSDRWSIENFLSLESYVSSVEGEENKTIVREVLERFGTHVSPKISLLRLGTIHNDVTETNLLIDRTNGEFRISGLIDFGDMRYSCLLFELATAIASFTNEDDVLESSGYLIAGYQAVFPLPGLEFELLYEVVCARLCQVFLITSKQEKECPNNEYLRKLLMDYLAKLKAWLSNSRDKVMLFWRKVEQHTDTNRAKFNHNELPWWDLPLARI